MFLHLRSHHSQAAPRCRLQTPSILSLITSYVVSYSAHSHFFLHQNHDKNNLGEDFSSFFFKIHMILARDVRAVRRESVRLWILRDKEGWVELDKKKRNDFFDCKWSEWVVVLMMWFTRICATASCVNVMWYKNVRNQSGSSEGRHKFLLKRSSRT